MPTSKRQRPTLIEEMALYQQGYSSIAGLDEAGRGCLAGPVVAAAVMLPLHGIVRKTGVEADAGETGEAAGMEDLLERFAGVQDSKQLSAQVRERLYDVIMGQALAVGVGIGTVEQIDRNNILQATKQAMRSALTQLAPQPQALLLDAIQLPGITLPQRSLIKGDARCLSIAAASIIAKVTRDRLMVVLHEEYPNYGFAQHKGYGTEAHMAALQQYGATPHHRVSFAPVREIVCGLFSQMTNQ